MDPALGGPVCAVSRTRWAPEVPSHLSCSFCVILCDSCQAAWLGMGYTPRKDVK